MSSFGYVSSRSQIRDILAVTFGLYLSPFTVMILHVLGLLKAPSNPEAMEKEDKGH